MPRLLVPRTLPVSTSPANPMASRPREAGSGTFAHGASKQPPGPGVSRQMSDVCVNRRLPLGSGVTESPRDPPATITVCAFVLRFTSITSPLVFVFAKMFPASVPKPSEIPSGTPGMKPESKTTAALIVSHPTMWLPPTTPYKILPSAAIVSPSTPAATKTVFVFAIGSTSKTMLAPIRK
jgi:hypothetical protein